MTFQGDVLKFSTEFKYLSGALRLLSPLVLRKIDEDNLNQLDDNGMPFCE